MIILMGVAGSGKSMQSRLLADEYGYAWVSLGEILRVLITGKRRQQMLSGKLLADEEVIQVMDKILDLVDTSQHFVLDGFPRTIPQAQWLLEQVQKGRFPMHAIFNLNASKQVVKARLHERGRLDDTDEAITKRFEEYETMTLPILDFFRATNNVPVYDIDASQEPRKVHEDIIRIVHDKPL